MDAVKDRNVTEISCGKVVHGKTLEAWVDSHPLMREVVKGEPVLWLNPNMVAFTQARADIELTYEDLADAEARLQRFAPYLASVFPEVSEAAGLIESEVREIPKLATEIARRYNVEVPKRLLMKLDSHLPISGSVKARGGIYEVLCHGEKLAQMAGLLSEGDSYVKLAEPSVKDLFSRHGVVVGSTGNLGLSIGIAASTLGFATTVHMSDDARAWKKAKLRSHGVNVVEHAGDYGVAVENGRKESERDAASYFVDDENSRTLFLGYAVGGWRLKQQLEAMGVAVTAESPLVVYLPCGVGGGPGGISFGLKQAFGDNVHCVFAEPTQSPCMLLGMYTGLHDEVAIGDFGISNHTAADGLAVGRPSGFVGRAMHRMISAVYSLTDDEMFALVYMAQSSEGIRLEPSAVAGAPGFARLHAHSQCLGISPSAWRNATHLIWATGGGMVPKEEYETYLAEGARVHAVAPGA
ncbi:D-serine ammonia-lyase [Variovorax sp. UMC13]|uniref:D-serine ammonia-lyase n=1 Tax=Variovorax sp. UMC13 TaxID=1862326 RepID=UPI0016006933|nr:D-serine ammonia-lyase [Variovorax sp. UMC13]MBB1604576.1 D-serine ammonia-lyase [Variovorax sp. UMC13]